MRAAILFLGTVSLSALALPVAESNAKTEIKLGLPTSTGSIAEMAQPVADNNAKMKLKLSLPKDEDLGGAMKTMRMDNADAIAEMDAEISPNSLAAQPTITMSGKDLLIAVVSAPGHYSARDAIRATISMDAELSKRADVRFFVGNLPEDFPFREEADNMISAEEGMVRLSGFVESYENLPEKALGIFDWGFRAGYSNVFKIDDDTYLHVDKALEIIDQNSDRPFMYAGRFEDGKKATVYDNRSKWYMQDQYPHELIDYAQGSGFMIGLYVLEYLHDHKDSLIRYRVDDAAMPIWLKDLPLQIVYLNTDHYTTTPHKDAIWHSPMNADEMIRVHNGEDFMPQICRDSCLCMQEGCNGHSWDTFMIKEYEDQIPRILL